MSAPLTTAQLSARLRLPRRWLRGEALSGRLPCLQVGRRLLFDLDAVRCVLAQRAAASRVADGGDEPKASAPS